MITIRPPGGPCARNVPVVLSRFLVAVGRYGRRIVAVGLVVAVVLVMAFLWRPSLADPAFGPLMVLSLCSYGLMFVAFVRPVPRAFEVRPQVPAFRPRLNPALVLATLGVLFYAVVLTGELIQESETAGFLGWLAPMGMAIAAVGLAATMLRGLGLELRPEGLRHRELAGTLTVPWDAEPVVPVAMEKRTVMYVRYGRPELVHRHGLITSRRRLYTDNIDQPLAARVIWYYVNYPEYRSAIGTHAEYDRLLSEISNKDL